MEAILRFDLPEDQESFELAADGWQWNAAIREMDGWLRSKIKYDDLSEPETLIYDECRSHLHEILREAGLRLD